ncbi:MAG: hypothetical protein MUF61_02980, partial [archaeon]|nr:hypothetical protein [archaeon]
MKKAGLLGLLALSFMFALPLAYAELFISSPSYLYNVGDKFAINTTVISGTNANDFLTMALVCATDTGDNSSEKEMEIFRVPLAVGAGEQKVIPVSGAFDNFLIGELRGVCSFRANFDGSTGRSSDFELSKSIDVVLNTEGFANPGESINVSGSAVKDNGKPSEGFVEVRVANSDANAAGRITNGRFAFSLPIPENARSGTYEVEARVYERDEYGKVTNEGSARSLVKIRQIVKKMNIAISSQSLVPGQELTYSIVLYDQAGDEAAGDVSLSIYDPSGKQVSENLVKAGGTNLWKTEPTFAPGNWQIGAKINSISGSNAIYLEELQNASFVIEGDNLVITNTGNVVYEKNVEITISDKKETKEVYLDVGESKVFYLSAPDGEYEIVASDGFRESQFSSFLTGNAIRVDDGGSRFWRKLYLPMWIMLIAIV